MRDVEDDGNSVGRLMVGVKEALERSIECAVCLERLTERDNRVLPCQHTFHLSCIQLIANQHTVSGSGSGVRTNNKYSCPECRALSAVPIHKLLPNYSLNKILQKLPLSSPPPQSPTLTAISPQSPWPVQKPSEAKEGGCGKEAVFCRALYAFNSNHPSCLQLEEGQVVKVVERVDSNWLRGQHLLDPALSGLLPVNHVEPLPVREKQPAHQMSTSWPPRKCVVCRALFDFHPSFAEQVANENNNKNRTMKLLTFSKGDLIEVERKVDSNWALGTLFSPSSSSSVSPSSETQTQGLFPLNYVTLESSPCMADNTRIRKQSNPEGSCAVRSVDGNNRVSRHMSFTSSPSTPSHFDESQFNHYNTLPSSSSSAQHSLPNDNSKAFTLEPSHTHSHDYRRRSPSLEARAASLPRLFVGVHSYFAARSDEIEVERGHAYWVEQICADGWFKGYNFTRTLVNQSGGTAPLTRGAFPGNFLVPADVPQQMILQNVKRSHQGDDESDTCEGNGPGAKVYGMVQAPRRTQNSSSSSTEATWSKRFNRTQSMASSMPPFGPSSASAAEQSPAASLFTIESSAADRSRDEVQLAAVDYPPGSEAEVELRRGDVVLLDERHSDSDGWVSGTNVRSNCHGLMPASFLSPPRQLLSSLNNSTQHTRRRFSTNL